MWNGWGAFHIALIKIFDNKMIDRIIFIVCSFTLIVIGLHSIITKSFAFRSGTEASPIESVVIGSVLIGIGICVLCVYWIVNKDE